MTLFADSSVWIDLLHDRPTRAVTYLVERIPSEQIVIGDLVLVEVLQGIRSDRVMRETRRALSGYTVPVVAGRAIAIQAAENYRALRARGITVRKTIDCLIATRCIAEGWRLLHSDRDFDPFVAHLGLRSALAETA